jgi:hypothetical protein
MRHHLKVDLSIGQIMLVAPIGRRAHFLIGMAGYLFVIVVVLSILPLIVSLPHLGVGSAGVWVCLVGGSLIAWFMFSSAALVKISVENGSLTIRDPAAVRSVRHYDLSSLLGVSSCQQGAAARILITLQAGRRVTVSVVCPDAILQGFMDSLRHLIARRSERDPTNIKT